MFETKEGPYVYSCFFNLLMAFGNQFEIINHLLFSTVREFIVGHYEDFRSGQEEMDSIIHNQVHNRSELV